ncbi:MAG: PAS domain S-box protein, partial [bacterium]
VSKSGKTRWVMETVTSIQYRGRRATLVNYMDITERKEAELAIQKSEERFRDLAELLPQTLFEIDPKGNITYTNRMGLETLKYSSEDVLKGLNALDMFIPKDQERVKGNIKNSLKGILPESHEYTAVTKDGDRFPVMVYSSPIIQRGKPIGLRGVLFDITSIKEAETALRISEARYRELADSLPQSVFEIDTQGNIIFFNQTGCDSFGYTREELENGINARQVFTTEDQKRIFANIKKDLVGDHIEDREYTALRKDGTTFKVYAYSKPIIRNGQSVGLRGVLVDLTPFKEAEAAVAESEEKYRHLVENVDATISIIDKDGKYLFINGVGARSFSMEKEDIISRTLWDIFPKNVADNKISLIRQTIDSGKEQQVEVESILNGKPCWFYTIAQLYDYYPGIKKVVLIIAHDITEKKLAERAVKLSEDKYRLLVNNVSAIIALVDKHGIFHFANKLAALSLDKEPEDIVGKSMLELFPEEHAVRQLKSVQKAIETGKELRTETPTMVDNQMRWYKTIIQPYRYDHNGEMMAMIISHDITDRKVAEKSLKSSEEKFRYLAEYSVQGIFIVQEGKFVFANQRGADIAGMTLEEIYKMDFVDFILRGVAEEYKEMAYQRYNKRLEGDEKEGHFELEYITPSGEKKWVELFTQNCVIDNKYSIYAVVLDNTLKKQAEEALKTSEEKFRYLAENSFQGIFIIQNNRIVFINQRGADIVGGTVEELYNMDFTEFLKDSVVPEYKELVMGRYRSRIAGEEVVNHYEFEFYTFSKEKRWLEIYSQKCEIDGIDSIYALINDLTSKKQAEEALRSSEEKFRNFAEHSLQGVYIVQDDKFVFVNQKAADITGIPIEKCLEMNVNDFLEYINSNDRDSARERYNARMNGDKSEKHLEVKYVTPKGEEKWLEFFSQRTFLDNKKTLYGILIDITLRKKAEEDIRKAQQERYNTIREIAGGVSHEMYNALYPAMAAIDKLKNNVSNDKLSNQQKQHLLNMTESSVDRAINMTEAVTHYSRIESEKKELTQQLQFLLINLIPKICFL